MTAILVEAPGLFTTVQDLGREGFGPLGVSPSGAADPVSLRLGNRLVGNVESAAGLEMTLVGATFLFTHATVLALTGSDFGATMDGAAVGPGASIEVRAGQTVRLASTHSGARAYLCAQGGIAVKPFLGSASTHILSGLGGLEGRALRKGDALQLGPPTGIFRKRLIAPRLLQHLSSRSMLRVTKGPQAERFSESSLRSFFAGSYRIGEQSNRMGLRLEGPSIPRTAGRQMITEGVSLGAIQVPDGGSPIILFVEQQTTGGYPKIANVISADLHRLGQLRPRDEVQFELVSFETARSLLIEQERLLASEEAIVE